MRYEGFCSGSYTSQSILADAERTCNWYPERVESAYGKSRTTLYPTPGFTTFCATSDVGGRALFTMNGRTLAVVGGTAGEVAITQSFASYGAVAQDNNLATISMNGKVGNQAFITSGSNGYNLNLATNALAQVLTGKSLMGGMLDGYFLSFDATQGRLYLSNINDGTTWDPTQFVQRSSAADTWKAMLVNPPDVWLIGSLSGDVWYDAGTFPFPLAQRVGLNFKYGIVAPFSLAASGPSALWLSQTTEGSGIVVRTSGYSPQRVSTYAVEKKFAEYARTSTISDAEAFVYQDQGHTFYVLNFQTANATWVYDLEMNQWHERAFWNANANREDVWKARVHTFAFGQHLTGDASTGTIASMDINNPTELDATAIRRVRRAPGIFSEHRQIPVRCVEIYLESGTSLQAGQGSDAVILWRTSDDGGRTWGSERQVKIGRVGQYGTKVLMTRMGVPEDRVNEMVVSDPLVSWRIVDAYINNDEAGRAT